MRDRREAAQTRHFLDLSRKDAATVRAILDRGVALKREGRCALLSGCTLGMIFERPSTRTRVSFETAMRRLGGDVINLSPNEMQLGRGETVADTARVLSRYIDAIVLRAKTEATLLELAANAQASVINGLTDKSHPCQILADVMTYEEHRGTIAGKTVVWVGDANNVCISWAHAAARLGFTLIIACPETLPPPGALLDWIAAEGADVRVVADPRAAATGADLVVTDTWVSMHNADGETRARVLAPYQVDAALMARAKPDALFMHCLPAHRGEEVTAAVIDGPQSVVFDEAENRMYAQMGVLAYCLA